MKKYLITGGSGFIGSNIAEKVLDQGDFVRIVDNFSTGRRKNIEEFFGNPNFELIEGDITDIEVVKKAVKDMDFVLHQAAIPSVQRSVEDPIKSNNANINGTLNMLIASKDANIKKFVYAASSSAYGENSELPKRENLEAMPISPYALQKYAGEKYCQIFWKIYGLPTVCLRYFNVFGPKQDPNSHYSAVIPSFIKAFLNNKKPAIFGTGEQSRDFTFVDNIISANLLAAESQNGNGEVMNIALGNRTSLNELVNYLKEITGKNIEPEYKEQRKGDVMHSMADISKAKKIIGYEPLIDFKNGLLKTVEWYKSNA